MSSYTVLHIFYALDPLTAPWPVALGMLVAALYLARRLWGQLMVDE